MRKTKMRKKPSVRYINGFLVSNDIRPQPMSGLWDDFTSSVSKSASNLASSTIQNASTALQTKAQTEVNELIGKITGTNATPVPVGSSTINVTQQSLPDQMYQQYFNAPMPQWLKYTLYGMGALAGLLLVVTLIRMATKKNN